MGKSIGSLGRKREPLDLTFDYFGETIRVNPHATDAVEIEFLEAGRDIEIEGIENLTAADAMALSPEDQLKLMAAATEAQAQAFRATTKALRGLIHPDDYATYWRLVHANGQLIRDLWRDIRLLTGAVLEATTDFPTGQPSDSAGGPSEISDSSAVGSPSPALRTGTDLEKALAINRGRPDLQEFFVMQHESEQYEIQEQRDRDKRDRERLTAAGLA